MTTKMQTVIEIQQEHSALLANLCGKLITEETAHEELFQSQIDNEEDLARFSRKLREDGKFARKVVLDFLYRYM